MAYPKNAASPPPVAIGAVVQISDGAVQTTGVTVYHRTSGTTENSGGGTTNIGATTGMVYYTPTQAETNYESFELVAFKTGCIPVAVTVVTTASATAGKVALADMAHGGSSASLTLGAGATISNASGSALTLTSSGANGSALVLTGNGSGHGISATGGATGNGFRVLGGATSGAGMYVVSQGGTGGANYAIYAKGNASGADTGGMYLAGGTTGGEGLECVGSGDGHGIYAIGSGAGDGMHLKSGTGNGSHAMHCEAVGSGVSHGLFLQGNTGGDDLACNGAGVSLGPTTIGTLTQTGAASLGVGSTVTFATLAVTGALSAGSSSFGNTAMGTLTQTGAASLGGGSTVTFATLAVTGALAAGSTSLGNTTVGTLGVGALTQTGAATLGVGSTVTFATLDVTGSLSVGTTTTLTGAVSATSASNDIRGASLTATGADLILKTATFSLAIADAVWDEALAGHAGAGTAGLALSTASSGGVDPSVLADAVWDEVINTGHAVSNSAGKILYDNLNATVSSRSSHSAADVKTAVEAAGSHLTLILEDTGTTLDALVKDIPTNAELTTAINTAWTTTTLTEGYPADGAAGTPAQLLYLILSVCSQFDITTTTLTARRLDGTTEAATYTLDSATAPTRRVRAT